MKEHEYNAALGNAFGWGAVIGCLVSLIAMALGMITGWAI